MANLLSYALTTVADVKESMGIQSSDHSWDNIIIRKINQVTRQIEAYCGRRFLSTVYTNELYAGTNSNQIVLRNRPVIGSVTLGFRDTSLNEDTFDTVDTNLYFTDTNSGILDLDFRAVGAYGRYEVSYTAGYATIPEDLAEATATLTAYYVLNSDSSQVGLMEKREGQRQIRYQPKTLTFEEIVAELGLDELINSYANLPVATDR